MNKKLSLTATILVFLCGVLLLISMLCTGVERLSKINSVMPHGEIYNLSSEATIVKKGIYSVKSAKFTIKITDNSGNVIKNVERSIENIDHIKYSGTFTQSELNGAVPRHIDIELTSIKFNLTLPIIVTVILFAISLCFGYYYIKLRKT